MPAAPRAKGKPAPSAEGFLGELEHPLKADILAVNRAVLAVSSTIKAGVKWNSLSWATVEYFGTVFLRSTESVQVVLHFGAKARRGAKPSIDDPTGLLEWKAADRAIVSLGRGAELRRRLPAFAEVVRQWIAFV